MRGEEVGQIIGKGSGQLWVAVGAVRDEVDVIAQGDQPVLVTRRGILHKDVAKDLILVVLAAEVVLVRAKASSACCGLAAAETRVPWIAADFVL